MYLPPKSDNNGNSDDIYSEPMPADLIDVIGPAPDNSTKTPSSTKMVMDNIDESIYTNFLGQEVIPDTYSSLQRGSSRVCPIIFFTVCTSPSHRNKTRKHLHHFNTHI